MTLGITALPGSDVQQMVPGRTSRVFKARSKCQEVTSKEGVPVRERIQPVKPSQGVYSSPSLPAVACLPCSGPDLLAPGPGLQPPAPSPDSSILLTPSSLLTPHSSLLLTPYSSLLPPQYSLFLISPSSLLTPPPSILLAPYFSSLTSIASFPGFFTSSVPLRPC